MGIGIDSLASATIKADGNVGKQGTQGINELLERIAHADICGLNVFGIGKYHRKEFLDSAPAIILAAAAAQTKNIILTSAVTVLSAADPVRVFQNFTTLDFISGGRSEIVVGCGKFKADDRSGIFFKISYPIGNRIPQRRYFSRRISCFRRPFEKYTFN